MPAHRRWLASQKQVAEQRSLVDHEVRSVLQSTQVQSGLLRGLSLIQESSWGADYSARLIGSYEKELHADLGRLVCAETPLIVDVGCADGYYVAGLARLAPQAHVIGYDVDPAALKVTTQLARHNGVADRVETRGECHPGDLCNLPARALVIIDCEGAEADLITADVGQSNPETSFIIECHDSIVPGISGRISSIFHDRPHRLVWPEPRTQGDAPMLPPELAIVACDELRSPTNPWLVVG